MREGPPYQDNVVEQERSIEAIAEDFVSRLKAGELVPLDGITGSRNLGVYDFEGKIAKVVKKIRAPKPEVVQELLQRTEDYPRVLVPEHVEPIDEDRSVLLMEKAEGVSADRLTAEDIEVIPDEHWQDFESTVRTLSQRGIMIDLTKKSNFFYDREKGFSFIDIGETGVSEGSTEKFYTKEDGKEYYYPFERFRLIPKEYISARDLFTSITQD